MIIFYTKQFLATLSFILTALAMAVTGVVFASPLVYRLAIEGFDLTTISGLTSEQLMDNYHTLLGYLTNPAVETLEMKYFSSSEGGLFHFEEVKFLFLMCFVLAVIGLLVSIATIFWLHKTKQQAWMERWFLLAVSFPLILLFFIVIAFDKVFILFHELLFRNDLWLFSPVTDPVITVLPEGLFMLFFVIAILLYELIIYVFRVFALYENKPKRRQKR
ncbi:TIGR01906 family membrane protein [Fundicoccus sp. Sow4_D5]|uniref:TIGR01906 family membrane protein n=1 Tax=unclassified Fundicoccus TaxID=2761543 RepID=UPI003F8F9A1E